jgi:hypothetical protein
MQETVLCSKVKGVAAAGISLGVDGWNVYDAELHEKGGVKTELIRTGDWQVTRGKYWNGRKT